LSTERRENIIRRVLGYRQPDLTVVMENIHDPHNASAILRTCDAAGVLSVQLVYTNTEFPDISKKSSASAKKWIEIRKFASIKECYTQLHKEGFKIYATHLDDTAKSIYNIDLTQKIAIVVGNEHEGVSKEAVKLSDEVVRVPMFGMIQSLNVSVATAVILFEAVRQRMNSGHYEKVKLKDAEFGKLYKKWLFEK